MFSQIRTSKYTADCSADIEQIGEALIKADAIVIGAGGGLSVSAGFTYSGVRFMEYFSGFHEKYGSADIYSGGFYPYVTPEEPESKAICVDADIGTLIRRLTENGR